MMQEQDMDHRASEAASAPIGHPATEDASPFETEHAELIAAYYRREIGRLMHQAEHWAANDNPLAVHHRVTKADSYYQIVSLFERHGKFDQNVFAIMRDELARQDINPPGRFPPELPIHRYRDPAFAAAMVKRQPPPADQVFVPGQWRCPKCKFVLQQFNLNANDGSVTTRDEAGDKCPNDGSPLWRVTWRDDAMEIAERLSELVREAHALREALEVARDWIGVRRHEDHLMNQIVAALHGIDLTALPPVPEAPSKDTPIT
jgi:hypothetical protein